MLITEAHLSSLAHLLKERVGFEVRPEGHALLRLALADRLREGLDQDDVDGYLSALREKEEELDRLLPLVTVGKTQFFRDPGQFRAFASLLPSLLDQARRERRKLSIWTAGCATGEEAYSIAIALIEAGASPDEVDLLATDVNPKAIDFATAGRYSFGRVEGISPERLERHFIETSGGYTVTQETRDMISRIRTHNLHSHTVPMPEAEAWDVIFCRNVLIYFEKAAIRQVVRRFFQAMRPGAFLFLGYSESLFKLFDGFRLWEQEGAFLYMRPLPVSVPAPLPPVEPPANFFTPPPSPPKPQAQPQRQSPPPKTRAPLPGPTAADRYRQAVRCIEAGSFDEASKLLVQAAKEKPDDLGILLTQGNLHSLLREDAEAETCFERAAVAHPMSAEVVLYRGMYQLERGRLPQAERELSRGAYLAPDFALVHYMLGKCRERQGNLMGARRSYRNALDALSREQKPLVAFYPDLPRAPQAMAQAARLALATL